MYPLNPVQGIDPLGLDAIQINYDYYPVNIGMGFNLPLGHGSTVTPTYYSDTNYKNANKYAEDFSKKHDCYSLIGDNCKTFAHDAATAGEK
ncbi:Uncharacterised protein [Salmonella enterica subsp. salamae]|nr:Uncharacterised protein [Salmonella enterica subsp. salamae]